MFSLLRTKEKKDLKPQTEGSLLKEHSKALNVFLMLFIGMTLAITIWYVLVPASSTTNLFESQLQTLGALGHNVPSTTGQLIGHSSQQVATSATGQATGSIANFARIFFNNVKVLIFCVVFSFIYGSGAIFILTWNASVLGVAIGNYIRVNLAAIASDVGWNHLASYLGVVSIGLFKYAIHGIPEIAAYFVGALAGGIISFSIIRGDFKGKHSEKVILDSADLLFIAIGLVFIAAILEVWVTPLIFH
jgi:uncharacterized membrane protein SpoIIM required for sporulation